jgi:hypothetical protein
MLLNGSQPEVSVEKRLKAWLKKVSDRKNYIRDNRKKISTYEYTGFIREVRSLLQLLLQKLF